MFIFGTLAGPTSDASEALGMLTVDSPFVPY